MNKIWREIAKIWYDLLVWAGIKKRSFREKLPPLAREHYDAIVEIISRSKTTNRSSIMNSTNYDENPRYEPNRSNLWIVELQGVDPFLAAEITPPQIYKKKGKVVFGSIFLSFHDPMGDSTVERLTKILEKESVSLSIKLVNHLGKVVEVWKMEIEPTAVRSLTMLNYNSAEVLKWQLEGHCLRWDVSK